MREKFSLVLLLIIVCMCLALPATGEDQKKVKIEKGWSLFFGYPDKTDKTKQMEWIVGVPFEVDFEKPENFPNILLISKNVLEKIEGETDEFYNAENITELDQSVINEWLNDETDNGNGFREKHFTEEESKCISVVQLIPSNNVDNYLPLTDDNRIGKLPPKQGQNKGETVSWMLSIGISSGKEQFLRYLIDQDGKMIDLKEEGIDPGKYRPYIRPYMIVRPESAECLELLGIRPNPTSEENGEDIMPTETVMPAENEQNPGQENAEPGTGSVPTAAETPTVIPTEPGSGSSGQTGLIVPTEPSAPTEPAPQPEENTPVPTAAPTDTPEPSPTPVIDAKKEEEEKLATATAFFEEQTKTAETATATAIAGEQIKAANDAATATAAAAALIKATDDAATATAGAEIPPAISPTPKGNVDNKQNKTILLIVGGAAICVLGFATGMVLLRNKKNDNKPVGNRVPGKPAQSGLNWMSAGPAPMPENRADVIPAAASPEPMQVIDPEIEPENEPVQEPAADTSVTQNLESQNTVQCSFCREQGKRDYQEDDCWYSDEVSSGKIPYMAIIADGMGGMENGAESSRIAIEVFKTQADPRAQQMRNEKNIPATLWKICNAANEAVYSNNTAKKMEGGTTLVCVYVIQNRLYWISVGDSRIYICRNGMLAAINEEHELETRMYNSMLNGDLELIDIRDMQNRELRKLTSNLGRKSIPLIDQNFIPYQLRKGDRLLLCSDGVSGTLSESEIISCLRDPDPDVCCRKIKSMVDGKDKRGQDNYTAIVVYIGTEGSNEN